MPDQSELIRTIVRNEYADGTATEVELGRLPEASGVPLHSCVTVLDDQCFSPLAFLLGSQGVVTMPWKVAKVAAHGEFLSMARFNAAGERTSLNSEGEPLDPAEAEPTAEPAAEPGEPAETTTEPTATAPVEPGGDDEPVEGPERERERVLEPVGAAA